jgi:hypothetical protein
LVGKPSIGGGLLVDPTHPEDSVLYRRLLGIGGPRMPSGRAPLDDGTTACVLGWIQSLGSPSGSETGHPPVTAGAPPTPTPMTPPTPNPSPSNRPTIRIGAGAPTDFIDQSGQTWDADDRFSGGRVTVNAPPVAVDDTPDDALYNHERWGGDDAGNLTPFQYSFAIPDGAYTVTLKFAETYSEAKGVGKRVFDVSIDGVKRLTDFDIFAQAGDSTAIDESFDVDVKGGALRIDFELGAALTPKVDAIAIVPK